MTTRIPFAAQQILTPESTDEPRITPVGVVLHRHGSEGSSEAVGRYFDREDVNTEAHCSVKRDGRIVQYMPLDRQADAQWAGNGWRDGGTMYGYLSVESEDDGVWEARWTSAQIDSIVRLLAWIRGEFGLPTHQLCKGPRSPGTGYHRLHPEWNRSGHYCVSDPQVNQIHNLILPALREDRSMAEKTSKDYDRIDWEDDSFAWAQQVGVMTEHSEKEDFVDKAEFSAHLHRYHHKVVLPAIEAAAGGDHGHPEYVPRGEYEDHEHPEGRTGKPIG